MSEERPGCDIVLVMVPPWEPRKPPLGLAYIAEYLRSRGLKPKVIDFNQRLYQRLDKEKRIFWEIYNINYMSLFEISDRMFDIFKPDITRLVEEVLSYNSKFIGFSVNIASLGLAGKISTLIKSKDKSRIIIFGGTGCFWENDRKAFILPEDMPGIDALVIGEGEEVLEKIIVGGEGALDRVKGVIHKKEDFFDPAIEHAYYTENIDRLPFPKFLDFDLGGYTECSIPVMISRGCIGRCTYCIDYLMCGKYRFRSPQNVFEEFRYHINENKASNFSFNDLICNGNLKQLEEICDIFISSRFNINWGSYAIIRKDMTLEFFKKMKKAGCRWLCYGLETASDSVLKGMNKLYTSAEAEKVIRLTHAADILTAVNIIVGFPGETENDFSDTISFIKRNREYISEVTNVSSFVIMPPSRVGKNAYEFGINLPLFGKDLSFYTDTNGTDYYKRIERVRKTVFVLSVLGIKNVIINQYGLKREKYARSVVLILPPPFRVDVPLAEVAKTSAYLKENGFKPIIYDLNIKLYNSAGKGLKYLWDDENRHKWVFLPEIFNASDLFADEVFRLLNEIISLPANIFYFYVTHDSLVFAIKSAAIIKKWMPDKSMIFSGHIFADSDIRKLVPDGTADAIISADGEEGLMEILSAAGTAGPRQRPNFPESEDGLDFEGFNLKEYEGLKLPFL